MMRVTVAEEPSPWSMVTSRPSSRKYPFSWATKYQAWMP